MQHSSSQSSISSKISLMLEARKCELSKMKLLQKKYQETLNIESQIESLKMANISLTEQNQSLKNELKKYKIEDGKIVKNNQKLDTVLSQKQEQIEQKQKIIKNVNRKYKEIYKNSLHLKSKLLEKQQIITKLQSALQECSELNKLILKKEKNKMLTKRIQTIFEKFETYEAKLKSLQTQNQILKSTIKTQLSSLQKYEANNNQIHNQLKEVYPKLEKKEQFQLQFLQASQQIQSVCKDAKQEKHPMRSMFERIIELQKKMESLEVNKSLEQQVQEGQQTICELTEKIRELESQNNKHKEILSTEVTNKLSTHYSNVTSQINYLTSTIVKRFSDIINKEQLPSAEYRQLQQNKTLRAKLQKYTAYINIMKLEIYGFLNPKSGSQSSQSKKFKRCARCLCTIEKIRSEDFPHPVCVCQNEIHIKCYGENIVQCWECNPKNKQAVQKYI